VRFVRNDEIIRALFLLNNMLCVIYRMCMRISRAPLAGVFAHVHSQQLIEGVCSLGGLAVPGTAGFPRSQTK